MTRSKKARKRGSRRRRPRRGDHSGSPMTAWSGQAGREGGHGSGSRPAVDLQDPMLAVNEHVYPVPSVPDRRALSSRAPGPGAPSFNGSEVASRAAVAQNSHAAGASNPPGGAPRGKKRSARCIDEDGDDDEGLRRAVPRQRTTAPDMTPAQRDKVPVAAINADNNTARRDKVPVATSCIGRSNAQRDQVPEAQRSLPESSELADNSTINWEKFSADLGFGDMSSLLPPDFDSTLVEDINNFNQSSQPALVTQAQGATGQDTFGHDAVPGTGDVQVPPFMDADSLSSITSYLETGVDSNNYLSTPDNTLTGPDTLDPAIGMTNDVIGEFTGVQLGDLAQEQLPDPEHKRSSAAIDPQLLALDINGYISLPEETPLAEEAPLAKEATWAQEAPLAEEASLPKDTMSVDEFTNALKVVKQWAPHMLKLGGTTVAQTGTANEGQGQTPSAHPATKSAEKSDQKKKRKKKRAKKSKASQSEQPQEPSKRTNTFHKTVPRDEHLLWTVDALPGHSNPHPQTTRMVADRHVKKGKYPHTVISKRVSSYIDSRYGKFVRHDFRSRESRLRTKDRPCESHIALEAALDNAKIPWRPPEWGPVPHDQACSHLYFKKFDPNAPSRLPVYIMPSYPFPQPPMPTNDSTPESASSAPPGSETSSGDNKDT